MGWKIVFSRPAGDRRGDHRRGKSVADIILDDQDRAHPALLGADDGAEIGVIDLSAFNVHVVHAPYLCEVSFDSIVAAERPL